MKYLNTRIKLGEKDIRSRIVMPPMVLFKSDGADWTPDEDHIAYYGNRARGGTGLIVVEATAVDQGGRLSANQLRLWDDSHIEPMSRIAKAIKEEGAVALVQIHHAGANTSTKALDGGVAVTPSGVMAGYPGAAEVRELSPNEIGELIQAYAKAASRAMSAGFDGVELHGAHGYLLSQFLSPAFNKREDEWGGDISGRLSMPLAVAKAVRDAVGPHALVGYRLGAMECLPSGLTLEDGIEAAKALEASGCIDVLNVSNGAGGGEWPALPEGFKFSDRMYLGSRIKREVSIPVIGVGGIKTPAQAEEALEAGLVDMIAIGTAFLADPEWAAKALAGRDDEIATCLSCKRCGYFSADGICPRSRKK